MNVVAQLAKPDWPKPDWPKPDWPKPNWLKPDWPKSDRSQQTPTVTGPYSYWSQE